MVKTQQSRYYGGDQVDDDDEESIKLFLKDCRQRQAALYSINPAPNSSVAFALAPLTRGEILYSSGQSRLHLHLGDDQTTSHSDSNVIDFLIFTKPVTNICKVPTFPCTLDDEAVAFRSHGLPLLVWPCNRDKQTTQKYLDDNYPDCGHWFRELDKSQNWLNEKWKPLAAYLGIALPQGCSADEHKVLLGLPSDSVTATFLKERIAWVHKYVNLLRSYLVHRRIATPGFQHNAIHHQLCSLHDERMNALPNDSGFFNVAGDRLLQLGKTASVEGKQVTLPITEMAKSITDSQKRAQFLSVLLPMSDLKDVLSNKKINDRDSSKDKSRAKMALTEALEEDSDSGDVSGSVSGESEDSGEASETKAMDTSDPKDLDGSQKQQPKAVNTNLLPNRPITKEIMENRGVVKYRHKRERNPRVHLRHKYRKSQIRQKSRVPKVRREEAPYAGEIRGIRVNMVRSHKFRKLK